VYLSEKMNIPRTVNAKRINVVFNNFLPDVTVICLPAIITGKIIANNGEKKKKNAAAKTTQNVKLTTSGYERYSRNL
jgi:hypothetical protein